MAPLPGSTLPPVPLGEPLRYLAWNACCLETGNKSENSTQGSHGNTNIHGRLQNFYLMLLG